MTRAPQRDGARKKPSSSIEQVSPMDVDQGSANPSTPPNPTRKQTSLIDRIPQQVVEQTYKTLGLFVLHDDDDDSIEALLPNVWITIRKALEHAYVHTYLANEAEFRANIMNTTGGKKQFIDFLRNLAKEEKTDSWKELFEHPVFLKPIPVDQEVQPSWGVTQESVDATVHAWGAQFKGNAAKVLRVTISNYLDKRRDVYARTSTIINSSGTGKSRMVDELSREIITVPMCLPEDGSGGFPPPDDALCIWFRSAATLNQKNVAQKLHAFVFSLLKVTLKYLKYMSINNQRIKHCQSLAFSFHDFMTNGQSFRSPGTGRRDFYDNVISMANKFMENSFQVMEPLREGMPPSPPRYVVNGKGVKEAGEELCKFVNPSFMQSAGEGPRVPLVIISFDESHCLTESQKGTSWTVFSELRRVLRGLVDLPIFALFLSTAGKFHQFSPEIKSDPSDRISSSSICVLDPITEISFDDVILSSTGGLSLD